MRQTDRDGGEGGREGGRERETDRDREPNGCSGLTKFTKTLPCHRMKRFHHNTCLLMESVMTLQLSRTTKPVN